METFNLGNSVRGTKFKININAEPVDGKHLGDDDIDFNAKVFVDGGFKSKIYKKADCKAIANDKDNYIVPIDSAELGAGAYYVTLTVFYPDNDFEDGIRTEVRTGYTGVTIDAR